MSSLLLHSGQGAVLLNGMQIVVRLPAPALQHTREAGAICCSQAQLHGRCGAVACEEFEEGCMACCSNPSP